MCGERTQLNLTLNLILFVALFFSSMSIVIAGPQEQAKRIHDRLAGVPPSATVLNSMASDIQSGDVRAAAFTAMDNPNFYNLTLKNLVTPWTNKEQTVFAPLNDYTATVIGMVRDNEPFNTLLSANLVYVGDPSLGLPAYSMSNNAHYEALENQGIDLQANLVAMRQSDVTTLPAGATAGVITTRAAAKAFFIDGTNRAMFSYTILNHLCIDTGQIKDNTRPFDRVRQDVSRSPGGDSRIFFNECVGCHTGMDPLMQGYAYYNYQYDSNADPDGLNGSIEYTPNSVQPKYLINSNNFKYGYITLNDDWTNYWRVGPNALLGWDTNARSLPASGAGAKSLGIEFENTEAFARCQVKKVFKAVCFREPDNYSVDRDKVDIMVNAFKNNGYNLKEVFADVAEWCMGN